MSDLQGRIDLLEQNISAMSGPSSWRKRLALYFTAPVYDSYRDALFDALCGPNPAYHFEVNDGPDRGHFYVFWWARDDQPVILRIQRAGEGTL